MAPLDVNGDTSGAGQPGKCGDRKGMTMMIIMESNRVFYKDHSSIILKYAAGVFWTSLSSGLPYL